MNVFDFPKCIWTRETQKQEDLDQKQKCNYWPNDFLRHMHKALQSHIDKPRQDYAKQELDYAATHGWMQIQPHARCKDWVHLNSLWLLGVLSLYCMRHRHDIVFKKNSIFCYEYELINEGYYLGVSEIYCISAIISVIEKGKQISEALVDQFGSIAFFCPSPYHILFSLCTMAGPVWDGRRCPVFTITLLLTDCFLWCSDGCRVTLLYCNLFKA